MANRVVICVCNRLNTERNMKPAASADGLKGDTMDKGFISFLISVGSLLAVIVSYTGIIINKKTVTLFGQVMGLLTLGACFWFLLFDFSLWI